VLNLSEKPQSMGPHYESATTHSVQENPCPKHSTFSKTCSNETKSAEGAHQVSKSLLTRPYLLHLNALALSQVDINAKNICIERRPIVKLVQRKTYLI
jgi:hypothetical protein